MHGDGELPRGCAAGGGEGDVGVGLREADDAVGREHGGVARRPRHRLAQRGGGQDEVCACLRGQAEHLQGVVAEPCLHAALHLTYDLTHRERRGAGIEDVLVDDAAAVVLCRLRVIEIESAAKARLLDDLVYEAVAVEGEALAVVGHREHPRGELRGMVVAAGARAARGPVVAGEQAVLAAVGAVAHLEYGIHVGIDVVGGFLARALPVEECASVVGLVHGEGHREGLSGEETCACGHLVGHRLPGGRLRPLVVGTYAGGVALGIVFLHHPVVVVAIHPHEAHGALLGARQDEGSHVVLGRASGELL